MAGKSKPPAPPDPHEAEGKMRSHVESTRLDIMDEINALREAVFAQLEKNDPKELKRVAASISMLEARVKAMQSDGRKAIEPLQAALDQQAAQLTDLRACVDEGFRQMAAAIADLAKAVAKPRKRTGVVQLPSGPISMTVTEH